MNIDERYSVNKSLIELGAAGQEKLNKAKIAIVGIGGLGSNCALGLLSLGIGSITLIDDDTIAPSNLTRQILYTEEDIGLAKSTTAAKRLKERNSQINYTAYQERLTTSNADKLLLGHDIIIDGSDNLVARIIMDSFCSKNHIPYIYAGVKGFAGQVSVFNFKKGKSFQSSFSKLENRYGEENCADSRVIFPLVSLIANIQVTQALNILLNRKPILQGYIQIVDLHNLKFRTFKLR